MIYAVMKTMALRLWRDKGALVLAFLLPGFIFAVFAAIFSTASGGELDLRVGLLVDDNSQLASQLSKAIHESAAFEVITNDNWDAEDIKKQVRLGDVDIGLIIHENAPYPHFTIFEDPNRKVATSVVKGQLRQILSEANEVESLSGNSQNSLFTTLTAMPAREGSDRLDKSVTYYVGATAILFLMFAAMQGAAISIEERRSGLSERLMVGLKGSLLMLAGKLLFLTLIGFIQSLTIIAVAAIFFELEVLSLIGSLTLMSFGAALLSSALALFTASLCSTQSQMHSVSTFIVLLFAAIGGSMVPRFMMPSWLQDAGMITPNYWVIEGYYGLLQRGQSALDILPIFGVIYISSIVLFLTTSIITYKLMRS
ncbi:ABC-2 type transport system permease protein [Litorimonas taeanensis]|uniref:ABC-2 type transport system permease protein n=1 Tax=Litorimonas taeanensis TaxID=568099 RepID=A0A420WK25_9PROT|nr:ABC transporter permease [Litorimonas taeanensis]RKQ71364.1 ABC-2 type transport system permease protein [Litorimonas taeanensis]